MQLLQAVYNTAFSAHCHHLEDALLGTVIAILGSTLTLSNPDIFVLLLDGEVHIVGKTLAGHQHLAHTQGTLHDKRLVDTYQILHPRKRQEIITDGNLTSGLKPIVNKEYIEDCRIEHDITVVADKGIVAGVIHSRTIHLTPRSCLLQNAMNKIIGQSQLEVEVGLASLQLLDNHLERNLWIKISKYLLELIV